MVLAMPIHIQGRSRGGGGGGGFSGFSPQTQKGPPNGPLECTKGPLECTKKINAAHYMGFAIQSAGACMF